MLAFKDAIGASVVEFFDCLRYFVSLFLSLWLTCTLNDHMEEGTS